jgi:hypothetical protein
MNATNKLQINTQLPENNYKRNPGKQHTYKRLIAAHTRTHLPVQLHEVHSQRRVVAYSQAVLE